MEKEMKHHLIAPLGFFGRPNPWTGHNLFTKYKVTACIPHINTPECLEACLALVRLQTVKPYVLIIDTGSPEDVCNRIEQLRDYDVEIHYIRGHGYMHSSEPVTAALDLAHTLCHTEYLFHTHADVFLRRRDYIEWCLSRCSAECPVVAYEMSPRSGTEDWRGTPSHTTTLMHIPTMRKLRAYWGLPLWYNENGIPPGPTVGWPDTESFMGQLLKRKGVKIFWITPETCPGAKLETNFQRHVDVNIDHVRSIPGSKIYSSDYYRDKQAELQDALQQAWRRAVLWQREAK
jgi:hypothetical protein